MSRKYVSKRQIGVMKDLDLVDAREKTASIPLTHGKAESGTWAVTSAAGITAVTRTTNQDTTEQFAAEIPLMGLCDIDDATFGASKGIKPKSVEVAYSVALADAGDDVEFHLAKRAMPANGAAPAAITILAGNADADYDTAHNTAAKRVLDTGAPEDHVAVVTIPSGEQAFLDDDEQLVLLVNVVEADDATAALSVIVKMAQITYDEIGR